MLLSLVPVMGVTASAAEWTTVNSFEELQEAVKNKQEHIKLGKDIDTGLLNSSTGMLDHDRLNFEGRNTVLDLNGNILKLQTEDNKVYSFIYLANGSLTIKDSGSVKRGEISGSFGTHIKTCTAGDDFKVEAHDFSAWTKVDDTTPSRTYSRCKKTGETANYTETANHNWQWVAVTPATPNADGKQHEECADCHAVKAGSETVIPALTSIKVENLTVTRNSVMKEPTAPTKENFDFDGWYSDKELKTKYDFSAKVTKSFTLYAKWTEKDNSINQIILTIGKKDAQVFGKSKTNDVAPKIEKDRTMLPARFVAENLGASVEWVEKDQKVIITKPEIKKAETK